ncbi:RimK family alpha-L-glutamate ligase [Patescibacteria group bacterium]
MYKVLVLYETDDWNKTIPISDLGNRSAFECLYSLARKNNVDFYRASIKWFKKGVFKKGWTFDGKKWIKVKNIKPNLIDDKCTISFENSILKKKIKKFIPIINDPYFEQICADKFISYLTFPDLIPKTVLIDRYSDPLKLSQQFESKKVVLKPPDGFGGRGVEILNKDKLKNKKIDAGMIMQEFIDTTGGIPGIAKGAYDLRLFMINEEIAYAYYRVAKKGELLSNIHRGAKMINIENKDIPSSTLPLVKKILDRFKTFECKIFTIDLFFDRKGKPYVVEINSKPGLFFYKEDKKLQTEVYLKMIDAYKIYLKSLKE